MLRVILAGLLGGIVMFIWSAIAHMAMPPGIAGMKPLPNQAPVMAALQAGAGAKSGFFYYPDMNGPDGKMAMQTYEKVLETAPQGLVIYQPAGGSAMTPGQLVGEFLLEVLAASVCAFLLRFTLFHTYMGRLSAVAVMGLISVITTNGSYWNWYHFPLDYTLANAFVQWVGYVLAGTMIALVYGWARRKSADD